MLAIGFKDLRSRGSSSSFKFLSPFLLLLLFPSHHFNMTFPNFLKQSPIPSVVNNQIFKASSTYDVINLADPRGKEILHSVSSVTEADVEKICQSASSAFPAWRATSFQKRREIFQNAQDLIKSRMEEWVAFTMEETSMTKGMATLDLILALDQIYEATHVLAQALRVDMAPIEDDSTERQMILREPYGVVFGIGEFMTIWICESLSWLSGICRLH